MISASGGWSSLENRKWRVGGRPKRIEVLFFRGGRRKFVEV